MFTLRPHAARAFQKRTVLHRWQLAGLSESLMRRRRWSVVDAEGSDARQPAGSGRGLASALGCGQWTLQHVKPGERLVTVLVTLSVPDTADADDAATLVAVAADSTALQVVHTSSNAGYPTSSTQRYGGGRRSGGLGAPREHLASRVSPPPPGPTGGPSASWSQPGVGLSVMSMRSAPECVNE